MQGAALVKLSLCTLSAQAAGPKTEPAAYSPRAFCTSGSFIDCFAMLELQAHDTLPPMLATCHRPFPTVKEGGGRLSTIKYF
jgi:hypothetical protein